MDEKGLLVKECKIFVCIIVVFLDICQYSYVVVVEKQRDLGLAMHFLVF